MPGLSEHIRVRSVIGRFLEHSRFFIFDAADRSVSFMGSADLMPRNLDHRVEVVTPVEDLALQAELASTFEALLARQRELLRARRGGGSGSASRRRRTNGRAPDSRR